MLESERQETRNTHSSFHFKSCRVSFYFSALTRHKLLGGFCLSVSLVRRSDVLWRDACNCYCWYCKGSIEYVSQERQLNYTKFGLSTYSKQKARCFTWRSLEDTPLEVISYLLYWSQYLFLLHNNKSTAIYKLIKLLLHVSAYGVHFEGGGYQRKEYLLLNTCRYKGKTRVLNKIHCKMSVTLDRLHVFISTVIYFACQKYPSCCSVCP
jgi:hypothetical protein